MKREKEKQLKKRIEQDLPYPKLTVQAELRFDQILSMLPDKERAAFPEEAEPVKRPAHYREPKPSINAAYGKASARGRWGKIVANCAISFCALFLLCVSVFHWLLPDLAQNGPAQPDSSLSAAGSQSKPTWETESENAVTVDGFEKTENGITLTMTLPTLPLFPVSTETCLPEIRLRTDRGTLLELSSAYGILEEKAGAISSAVEEGSTASSLSEGAPVRQDGYLYLSPGDPYTVTNTYMGDLTGVKQVIVTAYNFSGDAANTTPWPDGTIRSPVVLGEFTLSLETGEVKPSKTYEDLGLMAMSVSEYLEVFGADPEFKDHLWFGSVINYGWEWEDASDMFRPACGFICYADTEDDLPYEVNFYLNGELYQTVPFYRIGMEDEFIDGRFTLRGELFEKNDDLNLPDLWKDVVRRYYDINIFFDELYPAEWIADDNNPLADMDIYYEVINTDTGGVLMDSREFGAAGNGNGNSLSGPAAEAKGLASSNDVDLLEFNHDGNLLTLCISYPAFSTTDLAVVDVHAANAETGQIGEEFPLEISESPLYGELPDEPPEGIRIGDSITEAKTYGPIPEGTRQLIVRVRNVSEGEYVEIGDFQVKSFVFAEFLIDLESGEAVPSGSYIAEWVEDGNSPYDLQSISEYAETLLCVTSGYEGWFEQQFLGSDSLFNYGIEKDAPNMMLQFHSDVNIDLPMEAQFYVNGELARTVPLYRTEDSVNVENGNHPAVPDYETRRESSFLRVDPQHKLYFEDGSISTKRLYTAIAMFDGDIYDGNTIQVKVVCTRNGDVLYDSGDLELGGGTPAGSPIPVSSPSPYNGS